MLSVESPSESSLELKVRRAFACVCTSENVCTRVFTGIGERGSAAVRVLGIGVRTEDETDTGERGSRIVASIGVRGLGFDGERCLFMGERGSVTLCLNGVLIALIG